MIAGSVAVVAEVVVLVGLGAWLVAFVRFIRRRALRTPKEARTLARWLLYCYLAVSLIALRHSSRELDAGSVLLLAISLAFLAVGVSLGVRRSPVWQFLAASEAPPPASPSRAAIASGIVGAAELLGELRPQRRLRD